MEWLLLAFLVSSATATCNLCPQGSFSPGSESCPPGHALGSCEPCPMGSCAPSTGSSSCTPCSPGSYSNETGTVICPTCSAGTASGPNATQCEPCEPGSYSTRNSSSCIRCPPGTNSSLPGSTACESCSAGSVSAAGALTCWPCPAGQFANSSVAPCLWCPRNTFSPPGSTACLNCPASQFSKTGQDCVFCPPGQVVVEGLCGYCAPGSVPVLGTPVCAPCAAGTFSENFRCKPCQNGTYSPANASTCTECPANHFCKNASLPPVRCKKHFTSPMGSVACFPHRQESVEIIELITGLLALPLIPFHLVRFQQLRLKLNSRFLPLFHIISAFSMSFFLVSLLWSGSCGVFIATFFGSTGFCKSKAIHVLVGAYGGGVFSVLGSLGFIFQVWWKLVLLYYAGMELAFAQGRGALWSVQRRRWKAAVVVGQVISLASVVTALNHSFSRGPVTVISIISICLTLLISMLCLALVVRLSCTIHYTYRRLPFLSTKKLLAVSALQCFALLLGSLSGMLSLATKEDTPEVSEASDSADAALSEASTALYSASCVLLCFSFYGFAWILRKTPDESQALLDPLDNEVAESTIL